MAGTIYTEVAIDYTYSLPALVCVRIKTKLNIERVQRRVGSAIFKG